MKITRKNGVKYIEDCSSESVNKIKMALKGKLIPLKFDGFTRHNKHFVGINTQLILNGKVVIIQLGFIRIFGKCTGIKFRTIIEEVITSYDNDVKQIVSITIDNAANMLNTGKLLYNLITEIIPMLLIILIIFLNI